ncbi:MAG: LON peptidase substrate-binding domain-containing protein [Planctomycetes bacterium]|nr:LON peptidase substrate-binding domain-containing protein [Planctomycetota bacterium]
MEPSVVPLFPLPNVVLFPHMLLPLYIFEPRYRALTRDALAGDGQIAMGLLQPGWEEDYQGNPPVYDIAGLGRVLQHTELPDGRFHLMLVGIARVRLVEIVRETPYRSARVEIVPDVVRQGREGELEGMRRSLVARFGPALGSLVGHGFEGVPLPVILDVLASTLVGDPRERQLLMESADVEERCGLLAQMLGPPRRGPAEPSAN